MILGIATHFGQGWSLGLITSASLLGADFLRDTPHWDLAEKQPGVIAFEGGRLTHFDAMDQQGLPALFVSARPNPLYDNGDTPHSAEGLAAYGRFAAATVARFPSVWAVEVGNEVNAQNFIKGPVANAPYAQRHLFHGTMVDAVAAAISQSNAGDIEIIGGAMHSIPVGFARRMFASGAINRADAVAIHPYTSPPEHVGGHIDMLRAAMGPRRWEIDATEFGQDKLSNERTGWYLTRMTASLAAAGVRSAGWYALAPQSWLPNMELVDAAGVPKPAGEAFFVMADLLNRGAAKRLDVPLVGVEAVAFGDQAVVLWGEARSITASEPGHWTDGRGRPVSGQPMLDPHAPLIFTSQGASIPSQDAFFFGGSLIADSFDQFDVAASAGVTAVSLHGVAWTYFQRSGSGKLAPLGVMEGGEVQGEPWRPYLGNRTLRPMMATETELRPVDFAAGTNAEKRFGIVETAQLRKGQSAQHICARWSAPEGGVRAIVTVNQQVTMSAVVNGELLWEFSRALGFGDVVSFEVRPEGSSGGSLVTRRYQIGDADMARCDPATL